jgi:hypothetical protein
MVQGESRPALPANLSAQAGVAQSAAAAPPRDPRQFSLQWGTRARPSSAEAGLTIDDLNIGIYGHIPDHVDGRNRIPRGAIPVIGVTDIGGYSVCDAFRLWADNAGELYEEAIQRRWSTATDLSWESGHGAPEDVELALCQVATELATHAQVEMETISGWFRELNPVYHEVKLHLSVNVYDNARMFDGYRKRAMLNGGGMLMENPGWVNRMIFECYSGWTETAILMYLVRGSFTHTILRYLTVYGPTELDRQMAARFLADVTRHIQYGMEHVRFSFTKNPMRARAYAVALGGAEAQVARDERDHVLWEALAVVFGGGVENIDEGMEIVTRMRRDWVNSYADRIEWTGIARRTNMIGALARWLEPEEAD